MATPQTQTADEPFTHHFFDNDPGTARARKTYLIGVARASLALIIAIMGVLSIYWGALWKTFTLVHGLDGYVVDFDGGAIGSAVTGAFAHINAPNQITWHVVPASNFPNGPSDLAQAILDEKVWVAISINPGATAALENAVSNADASYNGSSAITVYAEEARNENSYSFILVPIVQNTLIGVTKNFTTQFVQSLGQRADVGTLLTRAPGVVTNAVYFTISNLRPFDIAVGVAIDFVGLIYLLIIAFITAMLNSTIRTMVSGLERRLRLSSLLAVRILVPLAIYFVISLFYSLVSVAFQVTFSRVFGHAGFVIYWMLSFCGMAALGLAVEALLTILTFRFIPFFLIIWIISNVSVSFFPIELLPSIFRYGYATPFYNVSKAVRCILFDTKQELGLNFGVLFAWIGVSLVTIPLFQTYVRRKEVREWQAQRTRAEQERLAEAKREPPQSDASSETHEDRPRREGSIISYAVA